MDSSKSLSKRLGLLFLTTLLHSSLTNAAGFLTDASQLPTTTYDFVIIGGGNAGNTVAARLTEDPSVTVLVIEAGPSADGVDNIDAPSLALENLPFSPYSFNYTTVPQTALNNRAIPYAKGRVIGGSSSLNFMEYTRSSNSEYDNWAKITGDNGWAWSNMEQYYLKNSRLVAPRDGHNTAGEVNPSVHGNGPVPLSLAGTPNPLDNHTLAEARAPGAVVPFQQDMNGGSLLGIGLSQSTIDGGERQHSGKVFLKPAMSRPNLHVLIENTVTRIIQTGTNGGLPEFLKVEFAKSANAARSTVTATKEIILAAGSIATPQILMLSGIGDQSELSALGINTIANVPAVGKHLQDHPIMANYWKVNSTETYDDIFRNPTVLSQVLTQWQQSRTGPLVASPATALGYQRLPDNDPIFQQFPDPSPGAGSGHFELIVSNNFVPIAESIPATDHYMTVLTVVLTPVSEGTVKLATTNPFDLPTVDPAFLVSAFDQHVMVQATHVARDFVASDAWKGFAEDRVGIVGSASDNDADILAAARQVTSTIWHPMSTARMSAKGNNDGAIDPDLKVKGVSGVRVIDGSSLPIIPATHPMAVIYLLAERGSDLVKQTWNLQ